MHWSAFDRSNGLAWEACSRSVCSLSSRTSRSFADSASSLLQATLDFEFLHQNMAAHVTPTASSLLAEIYAVISKAYSRSNNETPEELNRELEAVKRTLYDARKATSVNFLCLRESKPRTSTSSSASGGTIKEKTPVPAMPTSSSSAARPTREGPSAPARSSAGSTSRAAPRA